MVPTWTETCWSSFYILMCFNNPKNYIIECIIWIWDYLLSLLNDITMTITNQSVYVMKTWHFLKIRSRILIIVFIQIAFTFHSALIETATPYSLHIWKIGLFLTVKQFQNGLESSTNKIYIPTTIIKSSLRRNFWISVPCSPHFTFLSI